MNNQPNYNFAYNEGGLMKYVWNNAFSSNLASSESSSYPGKGGNASGYGAGQSRQQDPWSNSSCTQQNTSFKPKQKDQK